MAEQYYYQSAFIIGLNGPATTTTWVDSSPRNTKTTQPNGHVTDIAAGPNSGRAASFDKAFNAYLVSTAWSLDIGTSDFTIRFWFSPSALGVLYGLFNMAFGNGSAPHMMKNAANQLVFGVTALTPAVTSTAWQYVEICRSSGTVYVFLDGTLLSPTISFPVSMNGLTGFSIGRDDLGNTFDGGMADFQFISGIALHTTSFTRPSTRLDSGALPLFPSAQARYINPASAPQTPAVNYRFASPAIKLYDAYWGGAGKISGTTKVKGTPDFAVSRKVRLHREIDGMCVREQWSDAVTGTYLFTNIDATKKYTVITYDYLHNFRAVVADNLTPDPMP